MKRKGRRGDASGDRDGIRVSTEGRGLRSDVAVFLILLGCGLGAFFLLRSEDLLGVAPTASDVADAGRLRVPQAPERRHDAAGDPARHPERKPFVARRRAPVAENEEAKNVEGDPSDELAASDTGGRLDVPAADYIAALRERGETAGLAAFPPPGTRPPRSGVIVPADYELPEGFARYYQTTDDGRQLGPVLVVAPGYEIVDASGEPVPLVDDRIVPPEYAPPDLPVQMLEVPDGQTSSDDEP